MGCEKNNAHVLAELAAETLGADYGPFGALFESFASSFQNEEADDRAAMGLFILSTAAIYLEFAQPYYGLLESGLVVVVDITPPPPPPPSPPSPPLPGNVPRRSSWASDAILVDIDTTSTKFDRRIDGWVFGTGRGADRVEWLMARSPTQLFGPRLWKAAKSLVIADNGAPRGRVWCGECSSCKGIAGYQGQPNPPKIMCKACTADAAALALIMAEDSKKTSKKKNRCGSKIKKSNQWTKKKSVIAASPVLPPRALPAPTPPEPLPDATWVVELFGHATAATAASAYLDWLAGAVAAVAVARGVHSRREMDALGFVCY